MYKTQASRSNSDTAPTTPPFTDLQNSQGERKEQRAKLHRTTGGLQYQELIPEKRTAKSIVKNCTSTRVWRMSDAAAETGNSRY